MKNFTIAVLLAVLITYCFGQIATEWFDMSISLDDEMLSPIEAVLGITIAGVVLVIVGFIIAASIFGVLFFAAFAVLAAVIIAGVSALWPMILVLAFVVWLVKDKKPAHY